jgi:septum formation protein
MNAATPEIVLASGSPRRRELLGKLGVAFRVRAADIDEDIPERDPARMVAELARQKARAVARLEPGQVILAADTTVSLDGAILNKPASVLENAEFMARLSGRWHEVFTGMCVVTPALNQANGNQPNDNQANDNQSNGNQPGGEFVAVERTRVKFRTLSKFEIEGYANSGEGLDKAGGYGIQERGMALVEAIEGDFFNVVGLPISRLVLLAREAGLELLDWAAPTSLNPKISSARGDQA